MLALLKINTVIFKAPNSDFRPLQIAHNADFPAAGRGGRAQKIGTPSMIVGLSVREIQARNIQASPDHGAQRFFIV